MIVDRNLLAFRIRILSRCLIWSIVSVSLVSAPLIAAGQTERLLTEDQANSNESVELLIRLQSDRFSVRQQAMYEILQYPKPVIPLMEKLIELGDADFRYRTLKILEQVALNDESEADAAMLALRRISLSKDETLAQKAETSSLDILLYRQYVAALKLERLNAQITLARTLDNQKYPMAAHLVIGENWKGTRADLDQIQFLFCLSTLELNHEQVDDELIAKLDSIYTLTGIKLKRCSITDSSIRLLSRTSTISQLEVLYCPIGPTCFNSLEKFRQLSTVRLIGTNVDPSQSDLLQRRLSATVDIRRGAFLGIRYSPTSSVCRLTSLVPGSGAEQAGLRVGDEIIQFNQQPVAEFGDLTKILRQKRMGAEAKVKVKRGDQELMFDVVMGEWE